jgi:uncharacterized protein YuzE
MKIQYYAETDSLYIELRAIAGVETREIASGVKIDLDADGGIIGFDIDGASHKVDLSTLRQVEISGADLKLDAVTGTELAVDGASAFVLRDQPVMLAADVAMIFGVETREIVQNIKSNPDIFPERYAFELTRDEVEVLRSAGLISKAGRGGSRALPWGVTRKGAIRLATIMKSQRAIRAADIFVDVFDEVAQQLATGSRQLTLTNSSRIVPTAQDRSLLETAREHLASAMRSLFETVVDAKRNTTVADELQEVSAEAVNHVKAWLRGKSIANEKIEAETMLIIEQARDMYERRQADLADKALERERKALENVRVKIAVAQEMIDMYRKLEPSALVDLTSRFGLYDKNGLPNARQAVAKNADGTP